MRPLAPLIKPATVRVLLALATSHNWSLRQLDFNNTFLSGDLFEDVYMLQTAGLES